MIEAWASSRIGSTVVSFLRAEFAVCDVGRWFDVGGLVQSGRVIGLGIPAVPFGVTGGGAMSLAG